MRKGSSFYAAFVQMNPQCGRSVSVHQNVSLPKQLQSFESEPDEKREGKNYT
jgi:hypothetical protein